MLRFQTKTRAMPVKLPALAAGRAIQEVAAVELNAGFGCQHFEHASTRGLEHLGSKLQRALLFSFQNPIVVISLAELELLVVLIDPRPDGRSRREIKRCAAHSAQFPRRYKRRINRREFQSVQEQLMIQNILTRHAG